MIDKDKLVRAFNELGLSVTLDSKKAGLSDSTGKVIPWEEVLSDMKPMFAHEGKPVRVRNVTKKMWLNGIRVYTLHGTTHYVGHYCKDIHDALVYTVGIDASEELKYLDEYSLSDWELHCGHKIIRLDKEN